MQKVADPGLRQGGGGAGSENLQRLLVLSLLVD